MQDINGNKEDSNSRVNSASTKNNEVDKQRSENPNVNNFVIHHNPSYDDDCVVVQANGSLQGNLKNPFDSIPIYMSVEREKVNEDNAPNLIAHSQH